MSKGATPKADAMRAMREARYEQMQQRAAAAKKAKPREPETARSTSVSPDKACGYKQRSGGTGTCKKAKNHQGRHQYA